MFWGFSGLFWGDWGVFRGSFEGGLRFVYEVSDRFCIGRYL